MTDRIEELAKKIATEYFDSALAELTPTVVRHLRAAGVLVPEPPTPKCQAWWKDQDGTERHCAYDAGHAAYCVPVPIKSPPAPPRPALEITAEMSDVWNSYLYPDWASRLRAVAPLLWEATVDALPDVPGCREVVRVGEVSVFRSALRALGRTT